MKEKKHFTGVSMYLEVESTNWEHYFYVSYWRRNLHFTWSSQPRRGPAACSAKGTTFISQLFIEDPKSGTVLGIEPTTSRSAVKRSTDWANPKRSNHPWK